MAKAKDIRIDDMISVSPVGDNQKKVFEHYKKLALGKGFLLVSSTPLTRSSFHADDDFELLKEARRKALDAQKNVNKKRI